MKKAMILLLVILGVSPVFASAINSSIVKCGLVEGIQNNSNVVAMNLVTEVGGATGIIEYLAIPTEYLQLAELANKRDNVQLCIQIPFTNQVKYKAWIKAYKSPAK